MTAVGGATAVILAILLSLETRFVLAENWLLLLAVIAADVIWIAKEMILAKLLQALRPALPALMFFTPAAIALPGSALLII